jgi:membrane-associated protein
MFEIFDLSNLIQTLGLIGVIAVIYAESGLLIGFFLPGDSLLFTAGLFAAQGYLNFPLLVIGVGLAAFLGDNTGYWFGAKIGPKIFTREDSLLFKKHYVAETQEFFDKHGARAIVFARFIPVVRTFTPILAGVGKMNYSVFIKYNIVGALIWAVGISTLGYVLGQFVPQVEKFLTPIVLVIVLTSFIPPIREAYRRRSSRDQKKNIV